MSQTDIDRVQEFLGCQETGMVWRKADITDTSDRPGPECRKMFGGSVTVTLQ